jgi:mevalonate kinase
MAEATAPGKLVIVGEYGVLEGASAIAAAVDVRARAVVSETGNRARNALADAVIATVRDHFPDRQFADPGISINTDDFFVVDDGERLKLGLGSSAAAIVALTGALMRTVELPTGETGILELCYAAHRAFQSGRGSGIDIAAALIGGVVGIQPGATGSAPAAASLNWPDGLLMLPVWSGRGASTPELLSQFESYRQRDSGGFERHMAQLRRFAESAYTAWAGGGPAAEIMTALAAYDEALRAMDHDGAIGIGTATHDALRSLSTEHGAVYKTSGAGGGDFGLAFSDSRTTADSLRAAFREAGYRVLEKFTGVTGLTIID